MEAEALIPIDISPSLNTELTTTATIGVGAGSKKAKTYAELGLKGSIKSISRYLISKKIISIR